MKTLIVDYRISELEKFTLNSLGYNLLSCPKNSKLYKAIDGHPDILLHPISENKEIIVHKDISCDFIRTLQNLNYKILKTNNSLSDAYPKDIILNALNLKNIFLHKLDCTDPSLLEKVSNKKLLNTKQGYTKCSTAIVKSTAIMTSDTSIAKLLYAENIDVLLLPPKHIKLPHLDYGFIGGTCGLIDENLLAFFGDLECYPFKYEVKNFLKKHKVDYLSLGEGPLTDRGSIFHI